MSDLQPISVTQDREPHRWGAGGPGAPQHGRVIASQAARKAFESSPDFDYSALRVSSNSKSEHDEGDMDYYSDHELWFGDQQVWSFGTSSHSNIGGAWGTDSSVWISGTELVISLTHRGRTVGGGHDAEEQRRYALKDVLELAAVKAGAAPKTVIVTLAAAAAQDSEGKTTKTKISARQMSGDEFAAWDLENATTMATVRKTIAAALGIAIHHLQLVLEDGEVLQPSADSKTVGDL